jgi:chaperone modulatory protein CbpM
MDEELLTIAELARAGRITRARVARLVQLGLVEPARAGEDAFTVAAAVRLRRVLRLRADLGVDLTGAAIIVDLLERLERLEAELAGRRAGP